MRFHHFLPAFLLLTAASVQAQHSTPAYHIVKEHTIGGVGGWDYLTVDPVAHRLYVSHGTRVEVRDSRNGDSIGVIAPTPGVHGIALVPALHKGYISNGRGNNVTVFDLNTLQSSGTIKTGENPDAIFYDDFSKKLYVCNGRSHDMTVIDPETDSVSGTIALAGKPETAVSNDKGQVFVNIEDKNSISVIDTKTMKVTATWALAGGEEPSGLAIDTKTDRLFSGCGNKMLFVVDAHKGNTLAKLPIGDGCDGVVFDPAKKLAFSANGEGNVTIIEEVNASTFKVAATVPSVPGARTIAIDPVSHHIFLTAANMKAAPVSADNPKGRPQALPGSFRVLEIGE